MKRFTYQFLNYNRLYWRNFSVKFKEILNDLNIIKLLIINSKISEITINIDEIKNNSKISKVQPKRKIITQKQELKENNI